AAAESTFPQATAAGGGWIPPWLAGVARGAIIVLVVLVAVVALWASMLALVRYLSRRVPGGDTGRRQRLLPLLKAIIRLWRRRLRRAAARWRHLREAAGLALADTLRPAGTRA